MSKIIDFEEELKKRLEEKNKQVQDESFFIRFKECEERAKRDGGCGCDICLIKMEMADRILLVASDLAVEYMKTEGVTLYYGDLLEMMATATIKLKNYCQTDMEEVEDSEEEEKDPEDPEDQPE